ncbi:unnamed protein product [Symbiodinium natans]|uniref:Uncharacterized protein n=1 Tax=Symbiodinium natans TaxID=878477 RepID=A0A812URU6_9DINO|nr:unnamed protein product [Symbiodinium natans]
MERYVHLDCGICGERLYTDLCEFLQSEGSQPHIEAEVYTSQEPDILANLADVGVTGKGHSFNCSRNCHRNRWLIDAGTGVVDRKGYKYAIACGRAFVRIVDVPKVAVVMTVVMRPVSGSSATLLFSLASGDFMAPIMVEDLHKVSWGEVVMQCRAGHDLKPDTVLKFVQEDGTLLGKDHLDQTIAEIFRFHVSS